MRLAALLVSSQNESGCEAEIKVATCDFGKKVEPWLCHHGPVIYQKLTIVHTIDTGVAIISTKNIIKKHSSIHAPKVDCDP